MLNSVLPREGYVACAKLQQGEHIALAYARAFACVAGAPPKSEIPIPTSKRSADVSPLASLLQLRSANGLKRYEAFVDRIKMRAGAARKRIVSRGAEKSRRRFLRFFPKGFKDETYIAWERGYKLRAHERWNELLPQSVFRQLLTAGDFAEISARALKSLSGTNLIFSFESMALRDALKTDAGSRAFSEGLYEFLHGRSALPQRFDAWCETVASLPKKQSRVFTHPVTTVFGFIAQPETHIFLKPTATRAAAERYGFDFHYESRPSWMTYGSLLEFASVIAADLKDLKPRDMIDIQSFIWAIGSSEYDGMDR